MALEVHLPVIDRGTPRLGVPTGRPLVSWKVTTDQPDWMQAAFEIDVVDERGQPLWQSGRVASDASVLVAWSGVPLPSRQRATARVRVWGADGSESAWSAPTAFEVALLDRGDWVGDFITAPWDEHPETSNPPPVFRHTFAAGAGVTSARLYVTALGVYEVTLNGQVVGDQVLAPGWSSYSKRLRTQTYDVTRLIAAGDNVLDATVADGWYRGFLAWGGKRNTYGTQVGLLAQLELERDDGTIDTIASGPDWLAGTGPVRQSDIYNGEVYDARVTVSDWAPAAVLDVDMSVLVPDDAPPVRRTETLTPVEIVTTPAGKTVVDFGQNLVGWTRITVRADAGTAITLRHAEVMENGEICTEPLRHAKATDVYIATGGGDEVWEPRFTFHGFRYVEVDGWPGGAPTAADIVAVVCHSDMARTGRFDSSDPMVNRLHENVVWGMRGNFVDVPTDCPQRDERLGWTGDIQVFAPAGAFIYNADAFLTSWLADLAADQHPDGAVPFVIPSVLGDHTPTAAWGDAATLVPWAMYQRYGDVDLLERQYPSMRAWVECQRGRLDDAHLWSRGFQFGDWLDPTAPQEDPSAARADKHLVATAHVARSAHVLAETAAILGYGDDAARYRELAATVAAAFRDEFVTPTGRLMSDCQTAYALAIAFDLVHGEQRRTAGARLAELVKRDDYCIATGFVGTPLVCDALCATGHVEIAYTLFLQTKCPSWMYAITMGATTIWERWDSMRPDGSVSSSGMTSFNHYAFGAVADWMHRVVAGLAPAAPGYKEIRIAPVPGGGLTHASAELDTPYGLAASRWELDGGTLALEVTVPPNTRATIVRPGGNGAVISVGSGSHAWTWPVDPALEW